MFCPNHDLAELLAPFEIWVSHKLTLLNRVKDVELTVYWSAGITSPYRAKAVQVPNQGETIHQWSIDPQIHTLPHPSVCLNVCSTPSLDSSLLPAVFGAQLGQMQMLQLSDGVVLVICGCFFSQSGQWGLQVSPKQLLCGIITSEPQTHRSHSKGPVESHLWMSVRAEFSLDRGNTAAQRDALCTDFPFLSFLCFQPTHNWCPQKSDMQPGARAQKS